MSAIHKMTDDELTDAVAVEVLKITDEEERRLLQNADRDAFAFQVIGKLGERGAGVRVERDRFGWNVEFYRPQALFPVFARRGYPLRSPHRAICAAALAFVRDRKEKSAAPTLRRGEKPSVGDRLWCVGARAFDRMLGVKTEPVEVFVTSVGYTYFYCGDRSRIGCRPERKDLRFPIATWNAGVASVWANRDDYFKEKHRSDSWKVLCALCADKWEVPLNLTAARIDAIVRAVKEREAEGS